MNIEVVFGWYLESENRCRALIEENIKLREELLSLRSTYRKYVSNMGDKEEHYINRIKDLEEVINIMENNQKGD